MEAVVELKSSAVETTNLSLSQIIKLSETKSFALPEFKKINLNQMWAPESITPWAYLPTYSQLPQEVILRYNQLWALAVNEIFSLFEMNFLVRILESLQNADLLLKNPQLAEALLHFCEEERKHSEMFWQLGQAAAPEYYPTRKFHFVSNSSLISRTVLKVVTQNPDIFLMWVWMAVFFEERTLKYSKEYLRYAQSPRVIESNFVQAHRLHMMEEVRHVRMDSYLIDAFYRQQPKWKRQLAAWMMKKVIRDFASPRRMSLVFSKELQTQFPESKKQIQKIIGELPQLRHCREFQNVVFGLDATERTRELMEQFPEFQGIWDFMK